MPIDLYGRILNLVQRAQIAIIHEGIGEFQAAFFKYFYRRGMFNIGIPADTFERVESELLMD